MIPYNLNLFRRTPDQSAEAFCSQLYGLQQQSKSQKHFMYVHIIHYICNYVCMLPFSKLFSLSLPNNN